MKRLVFASRNQGKITEVKNLLSDLSLEVISLDQTSIPPGYDVTEIGKDFQTNARLKAKEFGSRAKILTLADDSGLIVAALGGRPGVYSKRYGKTDSDRIRKLLVELTDIPERHRQAHFVSVMCLYDVKSQKMICEEGQIDGQIALSPRGNHGFGYDPIFIPDQGDGRTLAELGSEIKNSISHRARALEKIKLQLTNYLAD